jgi:hypothetical protein
LENDTEESDIVIHNTTVASGNKKEQSKAAAAATADNARKPVRLIGEEIDAFKDMQTLRMYVKSKKP